MGDRANFGFRAAKGEPVLYLYGHWAGEHMLAKLANALENALPRIKMGDSAYSTRIAVSSLVGEDAYSETGWGLTIDSLCDNEHSIPIVDFETGTVSLHERPEWNVVGTKPDSTPVKFTMPIEAFITKFSKASILV